MSVAPRRITDFRAAVVGTGFIGRVHIEALRRLGVEVVGVLGSSPERARATTEDLGISRVFDSYQELLADPTIDVVHIASPNNAHFAQAKAALLAGKHVVCEKPLAMTSDQTRELRRIGRDSGLVHAVNYNVRFYSQVVEARARIKNRGIGDLRLISGSYRQDWLSDDTDWSWRVDTEIGGELRSVADIGSHLIDLLEFVTGRRVTHVLADLMTFVPVRHRPTGPVQTFSTVESSTVESSTVESESSESESSESSGSELVDVATDDASTMLVRFEGGARGVLAISQVSIGHKNSVEFEITGSESSLGWNSDAVEQLWIGHRHTPNEILWRDPSLLSHPFVATLPGGHVEGFENTFKALYRAVYQAVAANTAADVAARGIPFATFDDGHHEALVMDAILASARTSTWTAVASDE